MRQYRRLFELDQVDLEFTEDALESIAEQAIKRGTGARGLRAIMEEVLQSAMYDLPSRGDVSKCVVTREVVLEHVSADPRPARRRHPAAPRAPREVGLASTAARRSRRLAGRRGRWAEGRRGAAGADGARSGAARVRSGSQTASSRISA